MKVGKIVRKVNSMTFIVAQLVGLSLMAIGIVVVVKMSGQKFGLTNLQPLFKMISGIVFAIVGVILVGVSYTIRWKHRVIDRLDSLEAKPAVKRANSSLKRAYRIRKSAQARARRGQ